MSRPDKWWIGLLPLFILWLIANGFNAGAIEKDLGERITQALQQQSSLTDTQVAVAGRDATVSATNRAPNPPDLDELVRLYGVRIVRTNIRESAVSAQTPAVTAASPVASPTLAASGTPPATVPPLATPEASITPPATPEASVTPSATPEASVPPSATPEASVPPSATPEASVPPSATPEASVTPSATPEASVPPSATPEASLTPSATPEATVFGSITPTTPESTVTPAPTETPTAANTAPAGAGSPGTQNTTEYRFTAELTDQQIILDGFYPNEATHQQVVALTKRLFPTEDLDDKLKGLPGAPPLGFIDSALLGLAQLSRLQSGSLDLTGDTLKLSGAAFDQKAAEEIPPALNGALPSSYHADLRIGVAPTGPELSTEDCQKLLADTLAKGNVLFDSGTAELSADSKGFLDRILAIVRRCPQAKLEVAGYTDSSGDADFNLKLSKDRAEAVVHYLVQEGLPEESATSVGFGEQNPIAPNDTEEDRARNRRIEVHLR